jgi:hypothetical protein
LLEGLPRRRTLLIIVGLLVWFASGVEAWRRQEWGEVARRPALLLWQPWQALRAFVSREGDERLYHQYAGLMLGRPADLGYVARKSQGDPAAALARLQPLVRPGPGWRLPYRDFPVEYPPLPLALMLAPRLVADTLPAYRVAFYACMGILFLVTCWLGARLGQALGTQPRPDPVWRCMGWAALAIGPLLCARFDLLPALLTAAALWGLARRRDVLAGAALGLAVMTKLYPLLVALPAGALLWGAGQRARLARLAGVAALAGLAGAAPFLLTAPGPFLRAIFVYGDRPLHFESLLGALVLVVNGPAAVVGSHGSHNVATAPWLRWIADAALWTALLALSAAALRRGAGLRQAAAGPVAGAAVRWVFAALAVLLCLSKVLSPQFLIWLLPLAVLFPGAQGRRIFLCTLLAAALTHLFYPLFHSAAQRGSALGQGLLLARNAALVALAALACQAAARPAGRAGAEDGDGA